MRQAAIRLNAPEVKFSIATTRPAACTAMKAAAAPLALGSMRPTVSPACRARDDLAREQGDAEAKAALLERAGDRVLEDHAAALALARAVLERFEERALIARRGEDEVGHDVVKRRSRRAAARATA